jgi:hypothetical protein
MKKMLFLFLLLFVVISCSRPILGPPNGPINVYLSTGQSNANPAWGEAIANTILAVDPWAVVLHQDWPGEDMNTWHDGTKPREHAIHNVEYIKQKLGNREYNFRALFWFQGESDSGVVEPPDKHLVYEDKFIKYVNYLKSELKDDGFYVYINVIASSDSIPEYEDIRNVQFGMIEKYNFIYGEDTFPYERSYLDNIHVDFLPSIELGKSNAEKIIELIY